MRTVKQKLLDQIYDTLMGYVGFSEHNTPFPVNEVSNVAIDASKMYFEYKGHAYLLYLSEIPMIKNADEHI